MTDRTRLLPVLRVLFLVAVVGFAWWGLRGRFDEVARAAGRIDPGSLLLAVALVLLGLGATGVLWLRIMVVWGAELTVRPGLATFFIGQLGKYIPGSVWSLGAQADLARRHAVPPRVTVAAGLVFLGYHLATGVVVGAIVLLVGDLESPWPAWVTLAGLGLALVGLTPPVVSRLGTRVAGQSLPLAWRHTVVFVGLMAVAWSAYSVALVPLVEGAPWSDVVPLGGAFALSYAVGVVIVLAPAGLGAREGTFVLLTTPIIGVAGGTALALLARVVHTAADAAMAVLWWRLGKSAELAEQAR